MKKRMKGGSSSTLFSNPLSESESELRHSRSYSTHHNKENLNNNINVSSSSLPNSKSLSRERDFKPSSLQFCMQMNDDPLPLDSSNSKSLNIWDYSSDSEAAPASSWSTLPNKSLICRPLPIDIGRCTCLIVKEPTTPHGHGLSPGTFFSLYTYEGQGRQNRKLAVAHHKRRRSGRSHFTVAQNLKGLLSTSEDTFLATVTANLTGSKYTIWDQGYNRGKQQPKTPLAVVEYVPTIPTCVGSHRSIKAYVPKHQSSISFKNTTQVTTFIA